MKSEEKVVTSYSFLHTLRVSIFQFDKYHEIMQQKTRKMLVFLFELMVLIALILTGVVVLRLYNTYDYAYKFAKENLPNFTITKDGFNMEIDEPLIYKNTEYFNSTVIFDNNTENKKYLEEANQNNSVYLIFTKNSLVFKIPGTMTTEYKFADMFKTKTTATNTTNAVENTAENVAENATENAAENTTENTTTENKTEQKIDKEYVLKTFNEDTMKQTIGKLALYLFLLLFLSLMLVSIINIIALAVLGYVFVKIIRMPFRFGNVFNMAIAATALPSILLCVYMVINILTGFTIAKFDILYALISYIYLGAAVLILRSNMNRTKVQKEKKVAAETGNSNVEVTIEDSEDDSDEEDDKDEDSEEEK